MNKNYVIDTNTLVSRLLLSNSIPAKVVRYTLDHDTILMSDDLLEELNEILSRNKCNK